MRLLVAFLALMALRGCVMAITPNPMMIPLPAPYDTQNALADLCDTLFPQPDPAQKVMLKKLATTYKGQTIISLAVYVPSGGTTYTRYWLTDLYNPQLTSPVWRGDDLTRIYRGDVSKLYALDVQAAPDGSDPTKESGTWSDFVLAGYPTARMSSDSATPATHTYEFTGTGVWLNYAGLRNAGVIAVELFDSSMEPVGNAYYSSALSLVDGTHFLDMYALPAEPIDVNGVKRALLAENLPSDDYTLVLTVQPQETHGLFARTITALERVSNEVTATITADSDANHDLDPGDTVVIAGASDTSFNGTYVLTAADATSFTFDQVLADASATGGTATKIDIGTRFYDRGIDANTGVAPDLDVDDDFDDTTVTAKYMLETGNEELSEMVRPVGGSSSDWVWAGGTHGRGFRDVDPADTWAISNPDDGDMTAAYIAADLNTTWKRTSFTITQTCFLKLTDDTTAYAEVDYTHVIDQTGVTTTVVHTALIDYERKTLFAPMLHLRNRGSKASTSAGGGFDLFAVDAQASYQMPHDRTTATGDFEVEPGAGLGVLAWNEEFAWLCAVTEGTYATLLTQFPNLATQINSRSDGFGTKWYLRLYDSAGGTTVSATDTFTVTTRYSSYDVSTTNIGTSLRPLTAFDDTLSVPHNTPTDGQLYAADESVETAFVYSIVTAPTLGTVSLDAATGAYTYTPDSDVSGTDTFTFRVHDGVGYSSAATITVTVAAAAVTVMNGDTRIQTDDLSFYLYVDLDDDGVAETLRYSSTTTAPDLSVATGGRVLRTARLETLNGDALLWQRSRAGYADRRVPGVFALSWPAADDALLQVTEEAFMTGQLVSVRLDHRWRQLRVTSSGVADLTVSVASGYAYLDGDTAWLRAITDVVCGASDTVIYATASDGVLTVDSGTAVPTGSVLLARISIAASIVTVESAQTGVANARDGYLVEWDAEPAGANYTTLRVLVHERRA